ncbi:hypothetical protein WMF31_17625 [Sorangium sp. So ce1036]|uniref:hypothetical protein n=1 Tax=Sorangium sp. So ce1036 TaxID=3133328 RepID=UPI003F0F49EC
MAVVKPRAVTLHIGELEIAGLDPAGRFDVARGLEGELARLLASEGVPEGLLEGRAVLPQLALDHGAAAVPLELGRAVARALYEGWR